MERGKGLSVNYRPQEEGIREQLLQPAVFDLEFLKPLGVRHAHTAELAPPQVVAGL